MLVNNETQTRFSAEIRIVPAWAWALAGIAFVAAQWFFNIEVARHAHPPQAWVRPLLGLLAGLGGVAYLLLIGYICRDSGRRGMSSVLWTIVAVIIPNAMGIILYFILRQPLRSICPQCSMAVHTGFNFCPRCNYKLGPSCPQCQRVVGVSDVYCAYCGTSLQHQAVPSSASAPTNVPG